MIKWCLDIADRYLKASDWKTLAALKFCLFSLGMMAGVLLPQAAKRGALIICGAVFIATYVPLMLKLVRVARKK